MLKKSFYFSLVGLFSIMALGMLGVSCNRGVVAEAATGLVEKINAKEVQINGSQPAIFNNKGLQCRMFFVRHAEKDTIGRDPALLPLGEERAERLADIFSDLSLRRIYATNYQRTQLTAAPTASTMHLKTMTYDIKGQEKLLTQLIQQAQEGNYLIVGHSNSVPNMLNFLTGKAVYKSISEKIYDNLYVASIYQDGKVDILELKY